jgi:hypothetical protein
MDTTQTEREKPLNNIRRSRVRDQSDGMWDIYALAAEWKAWASQQKDWPPKNPDAAFLGFRKKRGPPRSHALSPSLALVLNSGHAPCLSPQR